MALYTHNNISTPSSLASGITNVALSFTVQTGDGATYPSGRQKVLIEDEIVDVSSRSGDVFTIISGGRGYGGTTAVSHLADARVDLVVTSEDYVALLDSAGGFYVQDSLFLGGNNIYNVPIIESVNPGTMALSAYGGLTFQSIPSGAAGSANIYINDSGGTSRLRQQFSSGDILFLDETAAAALRWDQSAGYWDFSKPTLQTRDQVVSSNRSQANLLNGTWFYRNGIGTSIAATGFTGTFAIKVPSNESAMSHFRIHIYNYSGTGAVTLTLGGYTYVAGSYWVNTTAAGTGNLFSGSVDLSEVRFVNLLGTPDDWYILLGDSTTSWSYPKIMVEALQGHAGTVLSEFDIVFYETGVTDEPTWDSVTTRQVNANSYAYGLSIGAGDLNLSDNQILNVTDILGDTGNQGPLNLWGGNVAGANIELYGATHPSFANRAYYDAVVHTFRDSDVNPTYLEIGPSSVKIGAGQFLDMNSTPLLGPADPTLGTHVGDRDYNDARYLLLSGGSLAGHLVMGSSAHQIQGSSSESLNLYGGPGATGARIELWSSDDATYPNNAYYDADLHTWRDHDGSPSFMTLSPTALTLNSIYLATPLDPTAGTHVGDRDYNDARYTLASGGPFLPLAGGTMGITADITMDEGDLSGAFSVRGRWLGGYTSPFNSFGAYRVQNALVTNHLWAASRRGTVSITGDQPYAGVVSQMFNGNWDDSVRFNDGDSSVITIDMEPEWGVNGITYPGGSFIVAMYFIQEATTITLRTKDNLDVWTAHGVPDRNLANIGNRYIYEWNIPGVPNYVTHFEISISSSVSDPEPWVTQIEYYPERPSGAVEASMFSKYKAQELFFDLSLVESQFSVSDAVAGNTHFNYGSGQNYISWSSSTGGTIFRSYSDPTYTTIATINGTGLVLNNKVLSGPLDPTLGTHVGDRDYNDDRYLVAPNLGTQSGLLDFDLGYMASRTLSTTVGDYVELLTATRTNGAHSLYITATVSDSGFSVSKTYHLSTAYNESASTWLRVEPLTDTGAWTGNDFDIEFEQTTNVLRLRAVRTAGATAGSISVEVYSGYDANSEAFASISGTGTGSASSTYVNYSFLPLSGGTMSGDIDMGGNIITGVDSIAFPSSAFDWDFETLGSAFHLQYNDVTRMIWYADGSLRFTDNSVNNLFEYINNTTTWEFRRTVDLNNNVLTGASVIRPSAAADITIQDGGWANRIKIWDDGDITFYKADGTTSSSYWDESLDRWNISTDFIMSGTNVLHIVGASRLETDQIWPTAAGNWLTLRDGAGETRFAIASAASGDMYFYDPLGAILLRWSESSDVWQFDKPILIPTSSELRLSASQTGDYWDIGGGYNLTLYQWDSSSASQRELAYWASYHDGTGTNGDFRLSSTANFVLLWYDHSAQIMYQYRDTQFSSTATFGGAASATGSQALTTKQFRNIYVASTAPGTPLTGDVWIDTT